MTIRQRHIAMWSGPRNISTAMMRSWGNRTDTSVCDEPFYAYYLKQTGLPHPGALEVIRGHGCDWRKVVQWLIGPVPHGKHVFYQKHMAHHLLPQIDRDWLGQVTNCFLIRQPSEMLTSLVEFIPQPTLLDTGLPQQVEIFEYVLKRTGDLPVVMDARDVLENPRGLLAALCNAVGVAFEEQMLRWPAGPRTTDGVWAKYWYDKVLDTTTFSTYRPKRETVPSTLTMVLEECNELYDRLFRYRLQAKG